MKIDDLRQLCAAATPGPWRQCMAVKHTVLAKRPQPGVNADCAIARDARTTHDAAFIAAARSAVPRLVAGLEVAQQQAADPGLWFNAQTAAEAYLQQELRRLHAALEGKP